jgi:ribosome recycling factor
MKVMEMATISATDNRSLVIVPFDPSTREEIIKGIQESNAGLTPISDGEQIRITIPPLTEERRQEYLKLARAKLEAGRIMIRQIRHEEMAKLKRTFEAKDITEDDRKRLEKQYQEITDEMIGEIDRLGDLKEKELMQI